MANNSFKESNFKELLTSQIWRFLGTVLLGVLFGYLVFRSSDRDNDPHFSYMIFMVIIFFIVGLIVFLVKVIPPYRRLKKSKKEEEKN